MSGPDRIWAYPSYVTGWNSANAHDRFILNSTEYIRADLVPQWQPIDTAPKDGTYVIGLFNGLVAQMKWSNGSGSHCYHWMALGRWTPIDPTHWMPLPEPPKTA